MISYDENRRCFHLRNEEISYVMEIEEGDVLSQLYFGKKISQYSGLRKYPRLDRSFSPNFAEATNRFYSLDTVLQEYPGNGNGDFREPAHLIKHENGATLTDFRYKSFRIQKGKPLLSGLPATYSLDEGAAETLQILLRDDLSNLELELSYTIYKNYPVITRSAKLINKSSESVSMQKIASMSLDFPQRKWELLQLNGSWARERMITREPISSGRKVLDSKRGSSSHQQNPFMALMSPHATETMGEVYGFNLVYSGNHELAVEVDPYDQVRIQLGINSFGFEWSLLAGDYFQTPEVVMVYSDAGLGKMSRTYHDLYRNHLLRGTYQKKERPILINNWEATYFDFDEDKILSIARAGKELGIELFVLDDGWFGNRNNDLTSLGDWFENREKMPNGLKGIADQVHQMGMKFGLWFEPEMISEKSELFTEHPDWAIQIPNRPRSKSRDQYVLDFSREDVRNHIYNQMKAILDAVPIDYIKWDFNRNLTEVYSASLPAHQQGEVAHRYVLGLYEFLGKLTDEYPDILFESCSGGGGRFDPGMLYYMPQTWTSDNTDAIARLKIQYGTSLVYPIVSMGAHVSESPNHQVGRSTSFEMRGNVAMSGNFGYELDLLKLTESEKELIKQQVSTYQKHRKLIQFGDFYRLKSPFEENEVAWMFVSKDKEEALVFYYQILGEAAPSLKMLQLAGVNESYPYVFEGSDNIHYGDELMHSGFYINPVLNGDYQSRVFFIKKKSE